MTVCSTVHTVVCVSVVTKGASAEWETRKLVSVSRSRRHEERETYGSSCSGARASR